MQLVQDIQHIQISVKFRDIEGGMKSLDTK